MGVAAVLHNSPGNHAPVVVSMICEGHESRVIQWDEFGCIAMLYQYAGHAAAFTVYYYTCTRVATIPSGTTIQS
jgi:hypothetical protein